MFFTLSLLVTTSKPCDIYKAAGTPCVAAHSTVRALSDSFHGPLYEIMSMKNGTTTLIHTLSPGGLADAAAQDAFCGAAACTISRILDQSGNANHLSTAPGGGAHGAADNGVNATALKIALGSHNVYGVYSEHGSGPGRAHSGTAYRCDKTTGIAKGDERRYTWLLLGNASTLAAVSIMVMQKPTTTPTALAQWKQCTSATHQRQAGLKVLGKVRG